MNLCHFHQGIIAEHECSKCKKSLCAKCAKSRKEEIFCKECLPAKNSIWNRIGEIIASIIEHT